MENVVPFEKLHLCKETNNNDNNVYCLYYEQLFFQQCTVHCPMSFTWSTKA